MFTEGKFNVKQCKFWMCASHYKGIELSGGLYFINEHRKDEA